MTKWHPQNFETFDVLDFLAALTAHVPNRRQRMINYYGLYSNKTRGQRRKRGGEVKGSEGAPKATEGQAKFRKTWAMLIKMVYEIDPLECPKCHAPMKIVAVIGDARLVEATLRRHGLWQESAPRPPPIDLSPPAGWNGGAPVAMDGDSRRPPPEAERVPWVDDPSPEE